MVNVLTSCFENLNFLKLFESGKNAIVFHWTFSSYTELEILFGALASSSERLVARKPELTSQSYSVHMTVVVPTFDCKTTCNYYLQRNLRGSVGFHARSHFLRCNHLALQSPLIKLQSNLIDPQNQRCHPKNLDAKLQQIQLVWMRLVFKCIHVSEDNFG